MISRRRLILFNRIQKSYSTFVPNFKILGSVVAEKSLTKKKVYTHTNKHTHKQLPKRQKLYTPYILCMPGYNKSSHPITCIMCWKLPHLQKYGLCHEKNLFMPYANNKDADQPTHPHAQPAHLGSLISTFVVHCLDSTILVLPEHEISRLQLVSVAEQAGLSLTWPQITKTGFLVTRLNSTQPSQHEESLRYQQRLNRLC